MRLMRLPESQVKTKLFGTDGVRGTANVWPITAEVAMQLGRALAFLIRNGNHRHRVVIGKDTRLSGYMLEQALAAGITSMGVDVELVGPLPTPGIANITTSMRADAGAVISASHNPYQDNGIKFFWRDGFKLPDETEDKLEDLVTSGQIDEIRPTADKIGRAFRLDDAKGRYIVFLKNTFPRELTLEGLKIVVDCAHGAAYRTAPSVLQELGAQVVSLGCEPNGLNINDVLGAVHPEQMARAVVEHGAHLGLALDGDADRLAEHGHGGAEAVDCRDRADDLVSGADRERRRARAGRVDRPGDVQQGGRGRAAGHDAVVEDRRRAGQEADRPVPGPVVVVVRVVVPERTRGHGDQAGLERPEPGPVGERPVPAECTVGQRDGAAAEHRDRYSRCLHRQI